ncbi:CheR family methyltransferase [Schauerella aestuarii]|uniref:CheR family methyltransferase n=1 Tax=Schauerella aestuarii TaxID=2511204 RepID=UPI00136D0B43|nr:protein-glutamate O-methyltransferase CheR [Achromobacter aestuarii]MYZ44530.1 chemotaxis protein CheR [Achromobacter aestuarii]
MNFGPFETLLKNKIGLDAGSIGVSTVQRAIRTRAQARAQGDIDAYWSMLQSSPGELQALIEAVVVPETWFFRYPESIALFASWATAQLAASGAKPVLRILSLPCSTGEEPYTLAMALIDAGVAPARFVIEAIDISPRVIEVAQIARYGRNSFRGDDLTFRDRHFTDTPSGFVLADAVRERVRFRTGNLLDPGLALEAAAYDFVFCRNLLIYFDRETQSRGLRVLLRACHAGSGMFVGPAEAALASQHGLEVSGAPRSFAFKIPVAPLVEQARHNRVGDKGARPGVPRSNEGASTAPGSSAAALSSSATVATAASARPLSAGAAPLIGRTFHERDRSRPIRSAQMAQAAQRVPHSAHQPSRTEGSAESVAHDRQAILATVRRMADAGRIGDALTQTQQFLDTHGPDADGFYLVGLFHDAQGNTVQARAFYRKALYLTPDHDEALLHLAALCEAAGDVDGAQRLRARRAKRVNRNA